jgi:WD40 repeat protein/energy-coupling factor transporter ATP-binding protein EcfA2
MLSPYLLFSQSGILKIMTDHPINPRQLSTILVTLFNLEGLRQFCFEELLDEVRFDDLTGGLTNRVIELVEIYERRNALSDLAGAVMEVHEQLTWDDFARDDAGDSEKTPGQPPYKGLDFFDEQDADLFFGREALTAVFLKHLQNHNFLAVIGASGSGKSSLVRAGLLPVLKGKKPLDANGRLPAQSTQWLYRTMTPTDDPLHALAAVVKMAGSTPQQNQQLVQEMQAQLTAMRNLVETHNAKHLLPMLAQLENSLSNTQGRGETAVSLATALAEDNKTLANQIEPLLLLHNSPRLLLYVDQFEELFTQCKDEAARRAFVDNLLTAVNSTPLTVIITLRADFYAHCAQHEGLRQIISQQQQFIGAMSMDELRQTIVKPAEQLNWRFDEGLVDLILDDIAGEPGALPLLSHALLETWQQRKYATMTYSGYVSSGGIRGAIAKTADSLLHSLTPEQQTIARHIFLQLTELGEETQDTRRRAPLAELLRHADDADQVQDVLEKLVSARLIITSEETAEVAHEALIREWPTLRQWLDESREGLLVQRALTKAAQTWQQMNKDNGLLYRGIRLAQSQEWAATNPQDVGKIEQLFLETSQAVIDAEIREKEEARRREAELLRLSLARQWAAQSAIQLGRGQADLALLLALEAGRKKGIPEALTAVRTALADPRSTARQLIPGYIPQMVWNQAKTHLLVANLHDSTAQLWDMAAMTSTRQFPHEGFVRQAMWSQDERRILTRGDDRKAKIWDAQTGEAQIVIELEEGTQHIAWSPDETGLLCIIKQFDRSSYETTGFGVVIDLADGSEKCRVTHQDLIYRATWDAAGQRFLTAGWDNQAVIWDAASSEKVQQFTHENSVTAAVWNQDESRVLTGSMDKMACLWDAHTGDLLLKFPHDHTVDQVMWNQDESLILTVSGDSLVKLFEYDFEDKTFEVIHTVDHGQRIEKVSWHQDEQQLLTCGSSETRLWEINSGQLLQRFTHPSDVQQVEWSADQSQLMCATYEGLWLYNCVNTELPTVRFNNDVDTALWNAQGDRVLILMGSHAAVWQPVTGKLFCQFEYGYYINDAVWHEDGTQFVLASSGVPCALFAADSGKLIHEFTPKVVVDDASITSNLAWHHGKGVFAAGGEANIVTGWHVATGQLQFSLAHDQEVAHLQWHEDGGQLLVVQEDGVAVIWDVTAVTPTHTIQLTKFEDLSRSGKATWHWQTNRLSVDEGCWDLQTGQLLVELSYVDDNATFSTQWHPSGNKVLASVSGDLAVLMDVRSGDTLTMPHQGMVQSLAFSTDGQHILTTSHDGTVRMWDAQTGSELLSIRHQDKLSSASWRPDECCLLVVQEKQIYQYYLQMDDLITAVCSRLQRNMTPEEWDTYMMGEPYRDTC